jgi:glutaredoxin
MAIGPWLINSESQKQLRSQLENLSWMGLLMGSTGMVVFSGYLMSVMTFEIRAICLYCILSAVCALSMFLLVLKGRDWPDFGQAAFTSAIVAMITLISAFALYAPLHVKANKNTGIYAITTTSQPDNISLAEHLTAKEIKMYGAFWCSHCHEQKQLFGKEAFEKVSYVECDAKGENSQAQLCQEKGVQSYPTWEIKGELQIGVKPMPELAKLSEYAGSSDFGVK